MIILTKSHFKQFRSVKISSKYARKTWTMNPNLEAVYISRPQLLRCRNKENSNVASKTNNLCSRTRKHLTKVTRPKQRNSPKIRRKSLKSSKMIKETMKSIWVESVASVKYPLKDSQITEDPLQTYDTNKDPGTKIMKTPRNSLLWLETNSIQMDKITAI